jgi:hypothetical protein
MLLDMQPQAWVDLQAAGCERAFSERVSGVARRPRLEDSPRFIAVPAGHHCTLWPRRKSSGFAGHDA